MRDARLPRHHTPAPLLLPRRRAEGFHGGASLLLAVSIVAGVGRQLLSELTAKCRAAARLQARVAAPEARGVSCIRCQGASGHPPIFGDGPLVCTPCVWHWGKVAALKSGVLVVDILEAEARTEYEFDWNTGSWMHSDDVVLRRRLRELWGGPA